MRTHILQHGKQGPGLLGYVNYWLDWKGKSRNPGMRTSDALELHKSFTEMGSKIAWSAWLRPHDQAVRW